MLEALLSWQFESLSPEFRSHRVADASLQRIGNHGDAARWRQALSDLPQAGLLGRDFGDCVSLDLEGVSEEMLHSALMQLHPWRKGPFRFAGVRIDAEWRSDLKWQRLASVRACLQSAQVLDVGCGNGYYGWRMLAAGARRVIGIDHNLLCVAQHLAVQRYLRDKRNLVFPIALSEIPNEWRDFDMVFSMGVLSHSRDPLSHLGMLYAKLRAGGVLVLESLVLGEGSGELRPASRYARMPNIWRLPGVRRLRCWLEESGFVDVELISVTRTTSEEQRRSEWMRFESLAESLDLGDSSRTQEGYPAPRRALLTARRP